ncbi:hypothetical protein AURDEDRAFT_171158 [Auricularia subglabra TFB-10046 SS5]|uniref:Major facilitator superfamily (MFS) profile domain-containing protein n=1 Tax=Auricularia subglabra (strain TFB-10046 / SS5) TaxID=717982 RepID=J0WW45_AURST|nr:hypothetical protein AURDEDRAFT_171158 [Auricularia subglabra TFB-10046 SS5]
MTGGAALFVLLGALTSPGTVVGLQALAGTGVGLCFQPLEMAVQALVPQADVAAALATLGFVCSGATTLSIVAANVGLIAVNAAAGQRRAVEDAF